MPSHHGVGLDEHERAAPVVPRLGQHDPKQAISLPKLRTGDNASQGINVGRAVLILANDRGLGRRVGPLSGFHRR